MFRAAFCLMEISLKCCIYEKISIFLGFLYQFAHFHQFRTGVPKCGSAAVHLARYPDCLIGKLCYRFLFALLRSGNRSRGDIVGQYTKDPTAYETPVNGELQEFTPDNSAISIIANH